MAVQGHELFRGKDGELYIVQQNIDSYRLWKVDMHYVDAFKRKYQAVERIKSIVPIWKKEFFEDGEIWIEGQQ